MNYTPTVSVIISTHNRADWLVEAIESVLAQSYQNVELIVVDDASTDDTADRAAAFGSSLHYVKLEPTRRVEAVRHQGIIRSQGEIIALLDDDDVWHPHKLAQQVAVLNQDQTIGLVYSNLHFLYADGSHSEPLLAPSHKQGHRAFDHLLSGCFIHPSTAVFRRTLYEQVGPFEKHFARDEYYFWLRAAQVAPVACVDEPLVAIRRYEDSMSHKRGIKIYLELIEMMEHLRQTMPLNWHQKFLNRRMLARLYTHVGLHHQKQDQIALARRYFGRSLRRNPLQRQAWRSLGQSLIPHL